MCHLASHMALEGGIRRNVPILRARPHHITSPSSGWGSGWVPWNHTDSIPRHHTTRHTTPPTHHTSHHTPHHTTSPRHPHTPRVFMQKTRCENTRFHTPPNWCQKHVFWGGVKNTCFVTCYQFTEKPIS